MATPHSSESPKQVLWVMGSSAAGKETFVRRVVQDEALAKQLGMTGGRIACRASLDYIAQSPEDPIVEKREEILSQVPRILEEAGVALVKWQFVDTTAERLERLQRLLPDAAHRAIVLHAPTDELLDRLVRKPWWDTYGDPDWVEQELPSMLPAIEALPDSFTVQHIKSGQTEGYAVADGTWNITAVDAVNPGATGRA